MNHDAESTVEQEAEIEALRGQIARLDISHDEALQKMIDQIKRRFARLDRVEFAKAKERIRVESQLIPPEMDLAFLDQTQLQIYINADTVPEVNVEEILEHEATEMIYVVHAVHGTKPSKEDWRNAHLAALMREYLLAHKKQRLEQHQEWVMSYLEKLKAAFPENVELSQATDRQIQERLKALEKFL